MFWEKEGAGIGGEELRAHVHQCAEKEIGKAKKVLLVPPDITRLHSRAGDISAMLYEMFTQAGADVDLLIALGTHVPMDEAELTRMFPGVPVEKCIPHDWRNDVTDLGEIPGEFVKQVSDGWVDYPIRIQLNRRIVEGGYDAIYCVGQVVPHEVAGLSSFTKHMLVGCGGWDSINRSHFLGAAVGAENIMGRRNNPVRAVFDKGEKDFLSALPLTYIMTVIGTQCLPGHVNGLYCGRDEAFDKAAELCVKLNLNHLEKQITTCVVYLDSEEYRSTWLGNKAVYRTRMALAPGARLIVLAKGIQMFGEDKENGRLIEKYGYCGRENILKLVKSEDEMANNLSVAAHLIHGSHDDKFSITYAVDPEKVSLKRVEDVGFIAAEYDEMAAKYPPDQLKDGFQMWNGEEIFFIGNPALGLWSYTEK